MSILHSTVGTLPYMSPQILGFSGYSYKCDIWSFGVICYELVFDDLPWKFKAKMSPHELQQLIQKTVEAGIEFPEGTKISDHYKDMIIGCLKYEEEDRYDWTQIIYHPLFEGKF